MIPTLTEIFVQYTSIPLTAALLLTISTIGVVLWIVRPCNPPKDKPVWRRILTGSWIPMIIAVGIFLTGSYGYAYQLHKRLVDPETRMIRATLSGNQITAVIGTEAETKSVEKEILGNKVSTVTIAQENSMEVSPRMLKWLENRQVRIAGEPIGKSAVNLLAKNG